MLLKRRAHISSDDFESWFLGEHARHAAEVGGERLLKYTGSFVVAPGPRSPWPNNEPAVDVVSEFWCTDRATVEATYADLAGARGEVNNVLGMVSWREAFVAEEIDLLADLRHRPRRLRSD